jgi:hypothetical protein
MSGLLILATVFSVASLTLSIITLTTPSAIQCDDLVRRADKSTLICEVDTGVTQEDEVPSHFKFN